MELNGSRLTGDLKDTGWERMTGERRSGRLTGTVTNGRFKITIKYSNGSSSSFQGNADVDSLTLHMTGLQYVNDKPVRNTRFTCNADRQGSSTQDVTGVWEGRFLYGSYRGHVRAFLNEDYTFSGDMEATDGTRWTFTGSVDKRSERMRITVNSGASKQTYVGSYQVMDNGSIKIRYSKDTGPFEATVERNG